MEGATRRLASGRAAVAACAAVLMIGLTLPPASSDEGASGEKEHFADDFADVAEQVPEFGGLYVDEGTNTLRILLTRPTVALARQVRDILREGTTAWLAGMHPMPVPAHYSWRELVAWRNLLWRTSIQGHTMSGILENENRLVIGLMDVDRYSLAARKEIGRLGIPEDAVLIKQMSPIVQASSLLDRHRPLVGGLMIQFQKGFLGAGTGTCTLGIPARRSGVGGFATASHCSRTQSEVDNGRYWQPTRPFFEGDQVGHETVDPPFWTNSPCPTGRLCRRSDANFVERAADTNISRGIVARVADYSTAWGGNEYRVSAEESPPAVGSTAIKVGISTGRTRGEVVAACLRGDVHDHLGNDTGITLLCQAVVLADVEGGDSGSPVFRRTNTPANFDVSFLGILWGRSADDQGTVWFWFSRINRIEEEVGAMNTCASGFSC